MNICISVGNGILIIIHLTIMNNTTREGKKTQTQHRFFLFICVHCQTLNWSKIFVFINIWCFYIIFQSNVCVCVRVHLIVLPFYFFLFYLFSFDRLWFFHFITVFFLLHIRQPSEYVVVAVAVHFVFRICILLFQSYGELIINIILIARNSSKIVLFHFINRNVI